MTRLVVGSTVIAFMLLGLGSASAQVTRQEALAMIYPGAAITTEQLFLTASQLKEVAARSAADAPSTLVARYVAARGGAVVGRAYVDTHTVRTKKESLLIALDETGHLKRVEVTAFLEPPEYRPPEAWLRQYQGRILDADLQLNRAIRPIAGASLTARAANRAVRRVLAIDHVLERSGSPK